MRLFVRRNKSNTYTTMYKFFASFATLALVVTSFAAFSPASAATQYASTVVNFNQGTEKDGSAVQASRSNPANALGAPDDQFVSLGFDGDLELMFAQPYSGSVTVTVSETTTGAWPLETAEVEVSEDGNSWTSVGTASNNEGQGSSPQQTELDVPEGMCVQYVRLTNTTDPDEHADDADGFDIDAVQSEGTEGCPDEGDNEEDGNDGNDRVTNVNKGMVINHVSSRAETGENYAGGSRGGDGGNSGWIGGEETEVDDSSTGNGGNGGSAAEGGYIQTGEAVATSQATTELNSSDTRINRCGCAGGDGNVRVRNYNEGFVGNGVDSKAETGENAAKGSYGGDGGGSGGIGAYAGGTDIEGSTTGTGGTGGNGSTGGTVQTGRSDALSSVVNMINRTITRITR